MIETVLELVNLVQANWDGLLGAALGIIGGFAFLARFTPNESDNEFLQWAWDRINGIAQNKGNSENA